MSAQNFLSPKSIKSHVPTFSSGNKKYVSANQELIELVNRTVEDSLKEMRERMYERNDYED